MKFELSRGVPLDIVVQYLQERGLICVIERDTFRVRWSPRTVAHDEGETFPATFLRWATAGDD